jgi:hypothetical protein
MLGTGIGIGLSGFTVRPAFSGFSPAKITGVMAWLDGSDFGSLQQSYGGNNALADGDPVGAWLDKSGNGRHFIQSSGTNKPTLKTSIINSKSVVRFDGVNDYIDSTGLSSTPANLHLFMVVKSDPNSAYRRPFTWQSQTGTAWPLYATPMYSGGVNFDARSANGQELDSGVFRVSTDISAFYGYEFTFEDSGKQGEIYKSKTLLGTTSNTSQDTLAGSNKFSRLGSGGVLNTPSSGYWSGDIAEIVIFDRLISGADLTSLQDYLTTKWGTY